MLDDNITRRGMLQALMQTFNRDLSFLGDIKKILFWAPLLVYFSISMTMTVVV